MTEYFKCL